MAAPVRPLDEGIRQLNAARFGEAEKHFRQAVEEEETGVAFSYLAYCRALTTGDVASGIAECLVAVKQDPRESEIYLNLGRLHLLAEQKKAAIRAFQLGLRCGRNARITEELANLGIRRSPPIPFLKREHPINKYLGRVMARFGLR